MQNAQLWADNSIAVTRNRPTGGLNGVGSVLVQTNLILSGPLQLRDEAGGAPRIGVYAGTLTINGCTSCKHR